MLIMPSVRSGQGRASRGDSMQNYVQLHVRGSTLHTGFSLIRPLYRIDLFVSFIRIMG